MTPTQALPPELWMKVFTFAEKNPADYALFAKVCRLFREIVISQGTNPTANAYYELFPWLKEKIKDWARQECKVVHRDGVYGFSGRGFGRDFYRIRESKKSEAAQSFISIFDWTLETVPLEHPNFSSYVLAATKMIAIHFKEEGGSQLTDKHLNEKINNSQNQLYGHLFDKAISNFIRDITATTPQSFKKRVTLIHKNFQKLLNIDSVYIETKIRQKLQPKFSLTLQGLFIEYNNPSDASTRFLDMKEAIRKKLESEKESLENELKELRGPSGCNGTIQKAFEKIGLSKKQIMSDMGVLIKKYKELPEVEQIIQIGIQFAALAQEEIGLKEAYNALLQREEEIERVKPGPTPIKEGLLPHVIVALKPAHLDAAARAQMQRMADFYAELNQDINETNQAARSAALHAIIDFPLE